MQTSTVSSTSAALWWLGVVRWLALAVFIIGVLGMPVTMLLMNAFSPQSIHDSFGGRVDPVSNAWYWMSLLGPSFGVLVFAGASVWKGFLSDPYMPWQELLLKMILGVSAALLLAPVMYVVTWMLPFILR